jgi:TatD DNase family protein
MRLIDSHAHLQAEAFAPDADAVVAAAEDAGVERLLNPGWDVPSSFGALELARRHVWIDVAVGAHPHVASQVDDAGWSTIVTLAGDRRVVAIGETGLDYDRAFSPRHAQLANLRRNLALALATRKPAVIHCRSVKGARDAHDELIAELRRAGVGGPAWREAFGARPPALLHSFSGPVDYAEAALELGLAISFSGLVFRAGEEASAAVASHVPADLLLVETDSPYLSPPGVPRRRNEPACVAVTARWLAEQRQLDPDALGHQLVANYDRIFRPGPGDS